MTEKETRLAHGEIDVLILQALVRKLLFAKGVLSPDDVYARLAVRGRNTSGPRRQRSDAGSGPRHRPGKIWRLRSLAVDRRMRFWAATDGVLSPGCHRCMGSTSSHFCRYSQTSSFVAREAALKAQDVCSAASEESRMTLKAELADALRKNRRRGLCPRCCWSMSSTMMMDQGRSRR